MLGYIKVLYWDDLIGFEVVYKKFGGGFVG